MTRRLSLARIAAYAAACATASTMHLTAHAALVYGFDGFFATRAATQTVANTTASNLEFSGAAYFCTGFNGVPPGSCSVLGNNSVLFTITPDAGYALNITGFSFDERNTAAVAPTRFDVFTSLDDFAAPILSGALSPLATTFTHHAVALSVTDLDTPFSVRIAASGHVGNNVPHWDLDNVRLDVTAVPYTPPEPVSAPASWALAVAALAGLGATRRLGRTCAHGSARVHKD